MKHGRATLTIALKTLARLGPQQLVVLLALAFFAVASAHGGGIDFSTLGAAALAALLGDMSRYALSDESHLRWLLLSAPLYGREAARAVVIAPACVSVVVGAMLGYDTVAAELAPTAAIACACGALVATMIGVSASLRQGKNRAIFRVCAFVAGTGVAYIGMLGMTTTTAASVLLAAVGSYFALRAFGETFARLDLLD